MDAIDVIRKIRKEKKYTQTEFANILGIKQSTYSDIENKRIQLKADDFIKLCKFLGLNLDPFIDETIESIIFTREEIENLSDAFLLMKKVFENKK